MHRPHASDDQRCDSRSMMLSELERTRPSVRALRRMRRAAQPDDFSDLPLAIRARALAIFTRCAPRHENCRTPSRCLAAVRHNARRIAMMGDEGLSRWGYRTRAHRAIRARSTVMFQRAISSSPTLSRAGKWTLHRDGSVSLSPPKITRGTARAPVAQRETAIDEWARGLRLTHSGFADRRAQYVTQ